jgi:hypothetical protein
MRAFPVVALLSLTLFMAGGTALAPDDPAGDPQEPVAEPTATPAAVPAPQLSPAMQEIAAVLDAERRQVLELTAVLTREADGTARLALVRRIERIKMEAEISVLTIQARYALAAGFSAEAQQLAEAASQLQTALDAAVDSPPAAAGR